MAFLVKKNNELLIYYKFWILRLIYGILLFFTVQSINDENKDDLSIFLLVLLS